MQESNRRVERVWDSLTFQPTSANFRRYTKRKSLRSCQAFRTCRAYRSSLTERLVINAQKSEELKSTQMISIYYYLRFYKYFGMSIELLQLIGLIAIIVFGFKFFFFHSSARPDSSSNLSASDDQKVDSKKQQIMINAKYSANIQSIDEVQKQSSEQGSIMVPKDDQQPMASSQEKFKVEAVIQDLINLEKKEEGIAPQRLKEENQQIPMKLQGKCQDSQQHPSQPDIIDTSQVTFLKDISIEESQQKPSQFDSSLIKPIQITEELKQSEKHQNNYGVIDVVSECEQYSNAQEVHSHAYRIQVSELQSKRHHKLKIVKEHYKSIIQNLKRKLEEACIRHNESLDSDINNQTITFSEEQTSFFNEEQKAELELKVEEVANLRDQLQLHEEILTNIIEQDIKLKDRVRNLQAQNSQLKTTLQNSIINPHEDLSRLGLSGVRSDYIAQSQVKSELGGNSRAEVKLIEAVEGMQVESRIMELYASQIMGSSRMKSSLLSSQALPRQSTISMMSLIEGVMNISLLGECRFLNEISKKFAIGQIKKFKKEKVSNAELIYNFEIQGGNYNTSLYAVLSSVSDLLVLIRFENLAVGVFTDRILSQEDEQCNEQVENRYLLLNLTKRKGYSREGVCYYANNQIIFGDQQQGYLSEFPPFIFHGGNWSGLTETDEKVTNVAVFKLSFQSQEA